MSEQTAATPWQDPGWVRGIHVFGWIVAVPGMIAVLILMFHICADLVARDFLSGPLPGTYELSTYYWMPIITFSALAMSLMRGEQIRATMMTERLPRGMRIFADLIALGTLFVFVAAFTYYGWQEAYLAMEQGEWMVSSVEVLIWPVRYIVPIGGVALCLQIISMLPEILRNPEYHEPIEVP